MAIESTCSGCGQKLSVADEHAGKRARCPNCGQIYSVPFSPAAKESAWTSSHGVDAGLAETLPGSGSDYSTPAADANAQVEEFWMRTSDGAEYGPVDRPNLNRWFAEGRVGEGYSVRCGLEGAWHPADIYEPQRSAASNPYAEPAYQSAYVAPTPGAHAPFGTASGRRYQNADPSGFVLSMGLLAWGSWLLCPMMIGWIPGILAWTKGRAGIREIESGLTDPANLQLVKVGYYLGMTNVIVTLLAFILGFGIFAIGLIA